MNFEVIVQLKKEVLDPEGRAIQETLGRLGFRDLKAVTVAKRYVLEFTPAQGAEAEKAIEKQVEQIAREYLANPVAETFQIKRL